MNLIWSTGAWEDYLYWHLNDKKPPKKINELIKVIGRTPFFGIGSPEPPIVWVVVKKNKFGKQSCLQN